MSIEQHSLIMELKRQLEELRARVEVLEAAKQPKREILSLKKNAEAH